MKFYIPLGQPQGYYMKDDIRIANNSDKNYMYGFVEELPFNNKEDAINYYKKEHKGSIMEDDK